MDNQTGNTRPCIGVDDSVLDLPYPDGFDPLCAGCTSLDGMYGPEDTELLDHIRHGHRDPDLDFEPLPNTVTFSKHIENISFALTEYNLLDNPSTDNSTNK